MLLCLLQAAERLYYIYQTLLDTSKALKAAGSEGEQAQQEAADSFQVCPVSMLKYTLRLMHCWSLRDSARAPSRQSPSYCRSPQSVSCKLVKTSLLVSFPCLFWNGDLQELWPQAFHHAKLSPGILFPDCSIAFLQESKGEVGAVMQQVHQGMCDDLNTPLALAALSAPLKAMNDLLSTKKGKKAKGRLHTLAQYQLALQETFRLLGMQVTDPQKQLDQMRQLALSRCVSSTCFRLCACAYSMDCVVLWFISQQALVHRSSYNISSLGGVI